MTTYSVKQLTDSLAVNRATVKLWIDQGLLIDVAKERPGIERSGYILSDTSLSSLAAQIEQANVFTAAGNALTNYGPPWELSVSALMSKYDIVRSTAIDLITTWGYFPGAIRLPGRTGAWRISRASLDAADPLIQAEADLRARKDNPDRPRRVILSAFTGVLIPGV